MPTYNLVFYDIRAYDVFGNATSGTNVYTGPATADGIIAITDNEAGIEGLTLDDDTAGLETATGTATLNGNTSTDSTVDAERSWTIRDTVTNEVFEVSELDIELGDAAGDYLISERPLVVGRSYETLAYNGNPDVLIGHPAFNYTEQRGFSVVDGTAGDDSIGLGYTDGDGDAVTTAADEIDGADGNDTIDGDAGDDTIEGGGGADQITGGAGDDVITGGSGDDTLVLSQGGGGDTFSDFATGDQINSQALTDVGNALTDENGVVTADEVTVTGGGGSDQILTFPGGETLTVPDGTVDTTNAATQTASLVAMGVPPCFALGTLIQTPRGDIPVEDLVVGDLVDTIDHGPQPLRWTCRREINFDSPNNHRGDLDRPIIFEQGSLGDDTPRRDLIVSPQHRMLLNMGEAAAKFGSPEVLARAKAMTCLRGVRRMYGRKSVTYFALLFDRHEVIIAEGAKTESFLPGPMVMAGFTEEQRAEIASLWDDTGNGWGRDTRRPARKIVQQKRALQSFLRRESAEHISQEAGLQRALQ